MAEKVIDWKSCQQKDFNNTTTPFSKDGKFNADCAPEVIYSWREDVSLEAMVKSQKQGIGPVAGHPKKQLFLSKTPLSSHGYGTTGVRVKLKKDVKFVSANAEGSSEWGPQRDCKYYKDKYPKEYDNLVIVAVLEYYRGFSEYILCSDGPIESWSYGTEEHFKEIAKEYNYYKEHPEATQHENVLPNETLTVEIKVEIKKDGYYHVNKCADGKDCSPDALAKRLQHLNQLVKDKKGEIFYMPGVEQDPAQHFKTEKKFYYSIGSQDSATQLEPKATPPTKKWEDLFMKGAQ